MERHFRITVDGRPYDVTVEDLGSGTSQLYPQSDSMIVPQPASAPAVAAPAAAPTRSTAAGPGDVVCTLGGVVDRVAANVGQSVQKGDEIVIVQAMKMNTPIVAPRAGKVTSITVKAGDPVEPGQVLATIA